MKWEYCEHPVHLETWNILGKEGWELIAVLNDKAYFKRKLK